MSSLPKQPLQNKDEAVKTFFNKYYTQEISYPANEVDAVVAFFEKRGFEKAAAASVSTTLLEQAKVDGVSVFRLIDTLKGLSEVQLSALVAEILNYNRSKTSTLGYRIPESTNILEARNIVV
jgi:hypothetical protein